MKILTREVIETLAQNVNTAEELIAVLEEKGFVRPAPAFSMSKREIVDVLKMDVRVRSATISQYLLKRLVEIGYLTREKDMQYTLMGRKPYLYPVSKKGENLIRLSANWKKKTDTTEVSQETEV